MRKVLYNKFTKDSNKIQSNLYLSISVKMCWMRGICIFCAFSIKCSKHQPITVIMKPAQCYLFCRLLGYSIKSLSDSYFSQTNLFCHYETLKHSVSLPVVVSIIISTKQSPALCVARQVYNILSSIKSKRRKFICFGNYDFIFSCRNSNGVKVWCVYK